MKRTFLFALAILFLLPSLRLLAQSGSGSIQGTVQDAKGAAISGAVVHVVNQSSGVAYDTKTNATGFYTIPSLFAGDYTLTFSAPHMERYQTSIALQVAQVAVINPQLRVGAVTDQVTVTGNAVQLATYDSGTISTQVDSKRINQLPMNGRTLLTLAGNTTPGLDPTGQRANGNMGEALEYTQDGAPMLNRNFGGESLSTQAQLPDPDSVQEVKIETSNSSAQFATPATAIITTKSGTNDLHGSLFETARNNAIGIAKARQDPSNLVAPHYVRNEFGASVGGPIVIPKLYDGHGKSFFFFAYERYSLRSFTSELVSVPTQAMRSGNFSGVTTSGGLPITIFDPSTTSSTTHQRTAFAGNQIPLTSESPLARVIYAITPLPTSADNPYVRSNYTAAAINNVTVPNITFRLDHALNESNHLFLRFTDINQTLAGLRNSPSQAAGTIAGGGLPAGASNFQEIPVTTISASVGYTHIFSPTFFSETTLGQEWFNQQVNGGPASNTNYEQQLGLPNDFNEVGFPQIRGLLMPLDGTQFNYGISQIVSNLDQNFTKIAGRHMLYFGGRYRHERLGYLPDKTADIEMFGAYATANLDPASKTNYTAVTNTGSADSDLFLGAATSYRDAISPPYIHYRDMEFDSYFQDNIHLSKNLTINAGIRWEIHPAPYTADGMTPGFDLANKAIVLANPVSFYVNKAYTTQTIITNLQNLGVKFETPQQAGIPTTSLYNNDFAFSPRLGIAYQPFHGTRGTVLRAGFGRYIYPVPVRNSLKNTAQSVPFSTNYTQSYIAANQSPDGLPNYLLRNPQTVVAGVNSAHVVNTGQVDSITPGVNTFTLDPHYGLDFVTQGNVTIEQPIKGGALLRVTYLYDHGTGLDQVYEINNHPSTYAWEVNTGIAPPTGTYAATAQGPYDQTTYGGSLNRQLKSGYSTDNSLQVNLERQYKSGYAFQVFYVFSRAFRVGGNSTRDSIIYPAADYVTASLPVSPGTLLAPSKELNRFENYMLDSAIPTHHVGFNGIVDLPFGRNRHFFRNSNRLVDELIGGYQVAFVGTVLSQMFQPTATNWGATSPIRLYRQKYKITDCRGGGTCRTEYQWFNGYIAPSLIGSPTGVTGTAPGFTAYQSPVNAATGSNNVPVTLANNTTVQVAASPGPAGVNPYAHTFIPGPYNYNADVSIFKTFPITQTMNLRINVDAFNAFNIQGYVNPNATDGTQALTTSYWTPRQIQLSARFTF